MFHLPKGIFVIGTDTGVGKTVVSAALAWTLKQSGKKVAVMKPVQTGTGLGGLMDIEFVQKVIETNYPLDEVCPYRFSHPLAPSVAANVAGERIDLNKINSAFYKLGSTHDTVIVEGAGGLLVPITESYLMSDLAFDLGLVIVIVARPGLGTLNHTLLTVESVKARGLEVLGIVINKFPSNPDIAERTNPELILKMTEERILGVLPFDPGISVEEGRIGKLGEAASYSFIPQLGGSFIFEDFLKKLQRTYHGN
ncbi:MAG TPA: dethiobiotin synthase [Thermodesulfobacteriota bacterium]|nr:dethiobiotin synthase [Thermodesulfobacteriota bacterium]